jgi:hypothetical protein
MTNVNTLARRGGKTTAPGRAVKVLVILAVGAVVVLLATSAAKTEDRLAKVPVSSAHAQDPEPTQKASPSPAHAKQWDPAEYAPSLEILNF